MDAPVAYRLEPGLRRARSASRPDSRRVSRAAHEAQDRSDVEFSPFGHDGPECPFQRPQDPEEQEDYDSGKQKRHTRKNVLVINEGCQICCLSPTWEGKASASSGAEQAGYRLPPGSGLYQAKGFQGCFRPEVEVFQPKKKPRGRGLTPLEQETNQRLSSIRMRLEQASGGGKRYRIVQDTIRLLTDAVRDTVMETCCGWPNFCLLYRP